MKDCVRFGTCRTVCGILTGQRQGGCRLSIRAFTSGCVCSGTGLWHFHRSLAAEGDRALRSLQDENA